MAATAKVQVGGPKRIAPCTFTMAAAPTVDNDSANGCHVSDIVVRTDTNPKKAYICVDSTVGAAVWKEITLV